ncbi:hypothetical protein DIPPA_02486 [Diplonema papillatum]|nr:hypothetical protein DIPPA_02486 [Diplonema papillatum]
MGVPIKDSQMEAQIEYLRRMKVAALLETALFQLSAEQPDNPVDFLAKHFESVSQPKEEGAPIALS